MADVGAIFLQAPPKRDCHDLAHSCHSYELTVVLMFVSSKQVMNMMPKDITVITMTNERCRNVESWQPSR